MKRILYALALVTMLLVTGVAFSIVVPMQSAGPIERKNDLAIEHVNVVDVRDGSIRKNVTVLVADGKILKIVPAESYRGQARFVSISAEGKYLIPGLWDMHTHSLKLSPQLHHPLFIAHGVTAVRDMSGCMSERDNFWACIDDRERWNAEALSGKRVSPRYLLQSSYQTNGGNEVPENFPAFFRLEKRSDAEDLVAFYKATGADFIKPYTELSLAQYNALVEAASKAGLDIAGHRPISVSLEHAIQARQKSIEHGRLFLFECYTEIDVFRKLDNPIQAYDAEFMRQLLDHQDDKACDRLMDQLARSDTWWVPTLTTLKMSAYANDPVFREDSRLDYIPFLTKQLIWFPDANRAAKVAPDNAGTDVYQDLYLQALSHVRQASERGVKLLAGTDSIDTYVFTGSSLHDELVMMVEAGLSPLEALQAATISAATFSGLSNEFGTIEVGKAADLVLIDDNPIEDINNTKKIFAVVFHGYYYDRDALHELTEFVRKQANSIQINIRFLWDALSSPLMRMQLAD